ncbi:hypothetical protein [Polaromonas eurypsychrophila]|uniref:Uncharacterized protein n=1 Tax=Polaromonas eurypsychrophila TaxID=1614635 RepID=A0A916WIZ6_9BURK|nr:hypothetical protein [Polaromonas eurypsychrophila]GGB02544.1 hypothetical protein GCM10011496_24440 [Polaromonas eurypsychrophila]
MPLSTSLKKAAPTLLLAGLLLALYAWQFGLQSPYRFELEWDEEVQLHDKRIINIHIKRSYERHSLLSGWEGIHRATEVSFDAGPLFGPFSARFAPDDLALIDQDQQVWYFATVRSAGTGLNRSGNRLPPFFTLKPGTGLVEAGRGEKLPEVFTRWNVMSATPDATGLVKFHNTRVGLAEKMRHWAAHPRSDNDEVRLGPKVQVR